MCAKRQHAHALRQLQDTFFDSRQANWDGYEALPVSDAAFLRGRDFLNQLLPRFPAPTTSATPGGALALEWFVSPKRRFLVSLAEDSRIAFAGLFGPDVVHGTGVFSGDVPSEIIQHLKRLFFL